LAKIITAEMGKILSEAESEVEKCAWEADWYAKQGPQMMADAPAPTGKVEAYVSYLPLGPILGIMPWNFPLWQVTRMGIPTLLAGNVVLVKHSPTRREVRSSLNALCSKPAFRKGSFKT
jgi:acyl-CoA reductase-like NAD-dependent aldehyde dehydrogenase